MGFENATLTYTSDNTAVVYIENGVLHCGEVGEANVTVTGAYNGKTYSETVKVTVAEAPKYDSITVAEAIVATEDSQVTVKGISHITGGGFYENIPRSIPDGLGAMIEKDSVKVLPIFELIAKTGNISERDMFNTFNMGVGMSIVVAPEDADKAVAILTEMGEDAYVIGKIVHSEDKIIIA